MSLLSESAKKEMALVGKTSGGRGWLEGVACLTVWLLVPAFVSLHMTSFEVWAQVDTERPEREGDGPRFDLGVVVVTATGSDDSIRRIPRNVTVITQEDIEQASSNNVIDLLARESGIQSRGLFGHDKNAGIDIRGMGDTASSNVIVMVDGVKLNSPDLAGPDLSSVPLDSIERIEIVRGAGSVLYGDGAVGGVVNIITKKGDKAPALRAYTSYGSYETSDSRASFAGKIEHFAFDINAAYYGSDGYRDNGYFRKKDLIGRIGYDVGDHVTLDLSASYHDDANGLPGGVSKEDKDSKERRKGTDRPDDSGDTIDRRYRGSIRMDLERWGEVEVRGSYRVRDNAYIMGFTPLLTREEQTDTINEDTSNIAMMYNKTLEILSLDQKVRLGVDHYRTEYIRQELSKDQRKNSDIDNLGVFVAGDLSFSKNLSLQAGYRFNNYDSDFREDKRNIFGSTKRWVNGTPSKKDWNNHAADVGLVYSLNPDLSFFGSYATSFRIPNVDELSRAQGDLRPQEGTHLEIGSRFSHHGFIEVGVTAFEIRTDDEIFFDGNLEVNRNYDDKTIRRGVETDIRLYVTDSLYLWGNYTYTSAKFENTDTWVPLVPEHMAKGGVEWQPYEPFAVSFSETYVGPRFDGNDANNDRFDKLDGYVTLDAKATYRWKSLKIFAGVNNVLNKGYSAVSYSEVYYPMPERNFYGGIEWTF